MKKVTVGIIISLVVLLMVGCASEGSKEDSHNAKGDEEIIEQHVDEEASNSDDGQSDADEEQSDSEDGVDEQALQDVLASFPSEIPEKVVTTSVPITEMLYLLGIDPIGVPTSTNPIPEAFDEIPRIGSPMQPDLEIVTSLEPDLLIGASSLKSTLEKNLENIKLERAYLSTDSLEDLKLSFKALGVFFNKETEMQEILQRIVDKENELIAIGEGKDLPSVMLMIGTSDSFMLMSENSYLGSLVKRLNAENIAHSILDVKDTYSAINLEDIVVADPDIIFVLASGDHGASIEQFNTEVEKNEAWKKLSAYKNDRIHMLDYSIFGVTSIQNIDQALSEISNYFYN